jgi:hypothetical protein
MYETVDVVMNLGGADEVKCLSNINSWLVPPCRSRLYYRRSREPYCPQRWNDYPVVPTDTYSTSTQSYWKVSKRSVIFIHNVIISFLLGKVSHKLHQQEMLTPLHAICTVQNILKGEKRLLTY